MRLKPLDYFNVGYLSRATMISLCSSKIVVTYFQAGLGLRFKMFTVIKLNCTGKMSVKDTACPNVPFASAEKLNYNSYFQELITGD